MAYENVGFEMDRNVQMTSFSSVDPSVMKKQDVEKSLPYAKSSLESTNLEATLGKKIAGTEMTTKTSAIEMQHAGNGENRKDEIDNTPRVVTKTSVRVDASDQVRRYESSQLLFYVQIAFFAMCGCLARIGTDKLFGSLAGIEDSGEIVNQSFFSNMFGSFVLGALNGSPMGKTRLAALCKGLTTGFCGSYTTWSKWNQQLSLNLIGETVTLSQSQVLSIASWFVGFYSYIGSYCVGIDFGKDIGGKIGKHVSRNGPKLADLCVSVLLVLAVIGFAFGVAYDTTQTGKSMWLAVLFAPFGACLRSWLSQFKIEKYKLPLGTLLANLLGAIVLAAVHVINVRAAGPACPSTWVVCWPTVVTYGVGTGFCACLTTISTFMSEIYKLRPEHPRFAYGYAILTVVICQILCGIINGVSFNQPM